MLTDAIQDDNPPNIASPHLRSMPVVAGMLIAGAAGSVSADEIALAIKSAPDDEDLDALMGGACNKFFELTNTYWPAVRALQPLAYVTQKERLHYLRQSGAFISRVVRLHKCNTFSDVSCDNDAMLISHWLHQYIESIAIPFVFPTIMGLGLRQDLKPAGVPRNEFDADKHMSLGRPEPDGEADVEGK